MADELEVGDPIVKIQLRRHDRARRMILRLDRASGQPILTMPRGANIRDARQFAADQVAWLQRQVAIRPAVVRLEPGVTFPFQGREVVVSRAEIGPTEVRGGRLHVTGAEREIPRRIAVFLREAARRECARAAELHAARIGRVIRRISIRDTRTRWGSCNDAGDLMFSWRLILAPDAVLDYVAAHEVAHLIEMNHSRRFWALVRDLAPGYTDHRDWLRRHGAGLLAIAAD